MRVAMSDIGMAQRSGLARRLAGSFATRGVTSIADQAASGVVTFIVSLFIGRVIGADALGLYATTNVLFLLVSSFYNGALLDPMLVYGPRRAARERPAYRSFLLLAHLSCILGIVLMAALAIVLWRIMTPLDDVVVSAVAACIGYACVILYQYLLRRHFYVEQKVFTATTQSVGYLLLVSTLLIIVYTAMRPSVAEIYGVLALASILVCTAQSVRLNRGLAMPSRGQIRQFAGEHWRYGRWVMATSPLYVCSVQGYYLLAANLLPPEQVGYLKAAETMTGPFSQVVMGLAMLMLPMTAGLIDTMPRSARLRYVGRTVATFLSIAVPYSVLLFFFGNRLLLLAFGARLAPALVLVPYISLIPILAALLFPASIVVSALKRPDLLFYSYGIATVAMISCGLFLMKYFGIEGAVIGMLISCAVLAATQLMFCLRLL